VFFNMTRTEDGKTRALDPKLLFEAQRFASSVYQSKMAARMRDLGYEIETGKNYAPEIKGYSPEYIAENSRRAEEIRADMKRGNRSGAGAAQASAQRTRERKLDLPREEIQASHQALSRKYGWQEQKIIANAQRRGAQHLSTEERTAKAASAVTFACAKSFERTAVASELKNLSDEI
jgi:conjugative relaxase-like TrwC/TraI family protein